MNRYKFLNENKEHRHTLDGKSLKGTTTIVDSVCPKPLTWWASGMAVGKMGWLNAKQSSPELRLERAKDALETIKTMDADTYLDLLDTAYKAHNEKKEISAEEGTDLHAEIEQWVKAQIMGKEVAYPESIVGFVAWARENVVKWLWSEGYSYHDGLWVGGIVDLGFIDKGGMTMIGDIKSSKEAYFAHFLQCGIYRKLVEQTGILNENGEEILPPMKIDGFAVFPKGKNFEPSIRYVSDLWDKGVESAVELYNLMNTQ